MNIRIGFAEGDEFGTTIKVHELPRKGEEIVFEEQRYVVEKVVHVAVSIYEEFTTIPFVLVRRIKDGDVT